MIAPLLLALMAMPAVVALWVVAWLVGDVFAGPVAAPVRVRSGDDQRPWSASS
jgi:hypothetical protein